MSAKTMTGAKMVVQALIDQGVDTVFGYPGGAVLPIYDEIFQQNSIKHILVRHEQGAVHAAEGYARSTGKPGVALVTSGPGATNAVTGLTDALLDSIPIIVLTGQVPTFMIGSDAFQEADTVGITRPCTKHNWLVKETDALAGVIHEAFHVAMSGRPGPVLVDIPKDVQFASGTYVKAQPSRSHYQPQVKGDIEGITDLVAAIEKAEKPLFYTGGGVINSGPAASQLLRELVEATGFPITSTLMGLGAYPASGEKWIGMLGMHGLYEANMAMHDCDLMINIGARFDDRITGVLDKFSPNSIKAHIDIDPSSINKVIRTDIAIIGDVAHVLEDLLKVWKSRGRKTNADKVGKWWDEITTWKKINCLAYTQDKKTIKPQHALARLEELTKDRKDRYITTEVGQHQMWAAQYLNFEDPNHWMTSGGLGTMGYGHPASIGVQMAHAEALVINIAGEASWLMNMQEMGTAVQYRLPVKQFILNNERLGMVRQWQELLHGERYSSSWSESLPDFVKLAEAFGAKGILCSDPADLDDAIMEMLNHDGPVLFDCLVEKHENCFPMIPSGKAHNDMLLGDADTQGVIDAKGSVLV
ncbi:acetolactate synthase, large subunit [Octadecabacter temperatus]|uniref:Acetolactate synthase n=1 Tax=Octadecabacter temperatus TaxID=1458307 RepID=A0A0K0Y656_9RHOB|nr:acetolactate synthase 3 large subunit [Octadecabacter temperatus]AKS46449.1 Acetolactate synthase isozyme 3 large subunit [Octadecabacter temperatus]SIO14258.1 acetolactate synthase, large subunit [Octadecabacter temperatus]